MRKILIVVGSMSEIKLEAVRTACNRAKIDAEVIGMHTTTDVNAQPEGETETRRGAHQRACAAAEAHPEAYAIGIESGIFGDNARGFHDAALITLIRPEDGGRGNVACPGSRSGQYFEHLSTSPSPIFPIYIVNEARRRGFDKTTVGAVMSERFGSPSDDPHGYLTGYHVARMDTLVMTLTSLMYNIVRHLDQQKLDLASANEPSYLVESNNLSVRLPVRTIEAGPRIAFFDLMSARALKNDANEWFAQKLAIKVTGGGIVVAPEGKSVIFADRFAKAVGLELIILRKKDRSVNPSIDNEPYDSVTTAGGQRLYITKEDAEAISGRHVLAVDDVISSGKTAKAAENLLLRNGARQVTHMFAFTEGDDWKSLIPPEHVIALGALPFPVP